MVLLWEIRSQGSQSEDKGKDGGEGWKAAQVRSPWVTHCSGTQPRE